MNVRDRIELMGEVSAAVREVGEFLIAYRGEVQDIGFEKGHPQSSIDQIARQKLIEAFEKYIPTANGQFRFELDPFFKETLNGRAKEKSTFCLVIDEIDGTTNLKRSKCSPIQYTPPSAICVALCLGKSLESIQIGVVYCLDSKATLSAIRVEDAFLSFYDNRLLPSDLATQESSDSKKRLLVIGYSNSERICKAEIEQALWENGICCYGGCRSSARDVINVVLSQFDGYLDARALWPDSGAALQTYDVAACIPVALGCGLNVTDVHGDSWAKYTAEDAIPILIARPEIHGQIIGALQTVIEHRFTCSVKRALVAPRSRKTKGETYL